MCFVLLVWQRSLVFGYFQAWGFMMIKKRIIAFDLDPQPMVSDTFRYHLRSKNSAAENSQAKYYQDPSKPRKVAHEDIADYMQVVTSRRRGRIQAIRDDQPKHVKQNILKQQVEALVAGQRSHALKPLRIKLRAIALALAENAKNWKEETPEQKRAENQLSVCEIKTDALVYENAISPTGYTYRRLKKTAINRAVS